MKRPHYKWYGPMGVALCYLVGAFISTKLLLLPLGYGDATWWQVLGASAALHIAFAFSVVILDRSSSLLSRACVLLLALIAFGHPVYFVLAAILCLPVLIGSCLTAFAAYILMRPLRAQDTTTTLSDDVEFALSALSCPLWIKTLVTRLLDRAQK